MALSNWLSLAYKLSIFIRFVVVIFPFTAFTTKDEIELLSDYMSASVLKFSLPTTSSESTTNSTNFLFPLIFGGFPSTILKILQDNKFVKVLTLNSVVVAPRLLCTLASLSIDNMFYKIARKWRIKPNLTMSFYCTSFVPWVFFSRCSSYLFDTLIFVSIFYVIVFSFVDDHDHDNCSSDHTPLYTPIQSSCYLGILISLGIFHRLKFVVFVLAPLLQFLSHEFDLKLALRKTLSFSFGFLLTSFFIAILDSLFYGNLNFSEVTSANVFNLEFLRTNLTFAPLNSLRETFSFRRLSGRIFHPWYTHAFVNIPFLYGVLGLAALCFVPQCFSPSVLKNFQNINAKYWLFLSSFVVPLICLSIYPVQETIHLCPLIIPLILMCVIRICQYNTRTQMYIFFAWISWNSFALIYHGFMRNGAIFDCLNFLQKSNVHLLENVSVSYHFLLTDLPSQLWYMKNERDSYAVYQYDKKTWEKSLSANLKNENISSSTLAYVFAPSTLNLCGITLPKNVKLKHLSTLHYHISPESPVTARHFFCTESKRRRSCNSPCRDSLFEFLYEIFSLRLFVVTYVWGLAFESRKLTNRFSASPTCIWHWYSKTRRIINAGYV